MWSVQGRVFDLAVTDVVFLVVLMIFLRRPSAACARFGTLAVDAPLAGCKRTVWASLGPTHRYFIDVWQQGQWANAPAGDEAAVSWMMCSSAWSGSGSLGTRESRVDFHSLSWKGEAIPRRPFVMHFLCLFNVSVYDWLCMLRWILVWSVCFLATSLSSGFSVARCSATMLGSPLMDSCHWTCFTAFSHARAWSSCS